MLCLQCCLQGKKPHRFLKETKHSHRERQTRDNISILSTCCAAFRRQTRQTNGSNLFDFRDDFKSRNMLSLSLSLDRNGVSSPPWHLVTASTSAQFHRCAASSLFFICLGAAVFCAPLCVPCDLSLSYALPQTWF